MFGYRTLRTSYARFYGLVRGDRIWNHEFGFGEVLGDLGAGLFTVEWDDPAKRSPYQIHRDYITRV